jgi:hypothetical protein
MIRESKAIGITLLCGVCLSLVVGIVQAASPKELRKLQAEEIEKIAGALPSKAVVKAKPRKMLVFWRCEGFYHGAIPVMNKASKPADADTGISWIKKVGEGRVFYCSFGHNNHIMYDPAILRHYPAGIQFAFGDYKVDTKPKP